MSEAGARWRHPFGKFRAGSERSLRRIWRAVQIERLTNR